MIPTRTAVRKIRPIWSSVKAQYSGLSQIRYTPHSSSFLVHHHPKRGIFGSPCKDPLDHFLGSWYETKSVNFFTLLRSAGVDERLVQAAMSRKTWTIIKRDADKWMYSYGILRDENYNTCRFVLDEHFYDRFIDGSPAACIISGNDDSLVEKYTTLEPMGCKVLETTRNIKDRHKMIVTMNFNGVVARKKFRRILSDDEQREFIGFSM